jgi:hypothetical protein
MRFLTNLYGLYDLTLFNAVPYTNMEFYRYDYMVVEMYIFRKSVSQIPEKRIVKYQVCLI